MHNAGRRRHMLWLALLAGAAAACSGESPDGAGSTATDNVLNPPGVAPTADGTVAQASGPLAGAAATANLPGSTGAPIGQTGNPPAMPDTTGGSSLDAPTPAVPSLPEDSAPPLGGMPEGVPEATETPEPPPSEPVVECDPADKTAEPTRVEFAVPGEGPGLATPTGEFEPIMENDPGIPTHTVIRPDPLGAIKHPILAWGEGGCGKNGNIGMFSALFMELASHGILVIADGPPGRGPTMAGRDEKPLLFAIEWAEKENESPCSQYYQKLDVTKIAVSGQSCGGLMAIQAATDPKITTAFPYNSGLFARDPGIYSALHAPMAIFDGGPEDIAYANGLADFNAIDTIPILFANPTSCSSNAHVCTFFDANAGEFGRAGVAWARWHLLEDIGPTGKGMFTGPDCGMCGSEWDMMWKMEP